MVRGDRLRHRRLAHGRLGRGQLLEGQDERIQLRGRGEEMRGDADAVHVRGVDGYRPDPDLSSRVWARDRGVIVLTPTLAMAQERRGSEGVFRTMLGTPRTRSVQ
jgi:hypothetical protein